MAPSVRRKFNAKARSSVAGGSRKKGKIKRLPSDAVVDTNVETLIPKSNTDKEQERRERMRLEMAAASQSKVSSKKRKRIENYISMKLKKEDRVSILEKLSQTQAELPSTLHLQSSATLGSRKMLSNSERLEKEEDIAVRQYLHRRNGRNKRRRTDVVGSFMEQEVMSDDHEADTPHDSEEEWHGISASEHASVDLSLLETTRPSNGTLPSVLPMAEVGSALQRNADGTIVEPKISDRKPKPFKSSRKFSSSTRLDLYDIGESTESESSFDSSETDNDSNPEEDEIAHQPSDNIESSNSQPRSGFKEWALRQISIAQGHSQTPPVLETVTPCKPPLRKTESTDGLIRGPLGETFEIPSTSFARHLHQQKGSTFSGDAEMQKNVVSVSRSVEVQASRLLLPIVSEEQPIVEAVLLHPVVVICGETGCGKTTQVPQFLYEAGFGSATSDNPGMIGITQPRRVAAISMANRVANELSLPASRISYQIRYDATTAPATVIKFMTDGVLLREMTTDFLLSKYSVIIIDEAHERSMNTDILIGVLSRVLRVREEMWKEGNAGIKPLRLIIMSATLRVADFAQNKTLFPTAPPVITISARQHPVTIHFNRRTPADYVSEAVRKAVKIHTRLPDGGILIFLTGQNEITGVCRRLGKRFGRKALIEKIKTRRGQKSDKEGQLVHEEIEVSRSARPQEENIEPEDIDLGNNEPSVVEIDDKVDPTNDLDELDTENDDEDELGIDDTDVPMHIVPLYSLLATDKQLQAFLPPPPDSRLVVVATNVAETSVTIPGIRYVIDCGRAKQRRYDPASGIQSFEITWISKASAAQRSGRAGRTGPGHCYRLYSSPVFENHFEAFSEPEILRMPIEGVVLQMKSMHVDAVINFPFPTPPDRATLKKAETTLTHLGALTMSKLSSFSGQITDLGKAMSLFPLSPRFSKMLVVGRQHGCLPFVIAIVSALSVGDPFMREDTIDHEEEDDESDGGIDPIIANINSEVLRAKELRKNKRRQFFKAQQMHSALGNGSSDAFRVLSVVGAYEYSGDQSEFCNEHFVRPKAMEEIHKLRLQITNIVHASFPDVPLMSELKFSPPTDIQCKVLRQLLAAGFIDQVAARKEFVDPGSTNGVKFASSRGVPYRALGVSEDVFIHPSSVLFHGAPPDFVVFQEVVLTSRIWIKGLTVVNPAWLSQLGPSLCSFSKPLNPIPANVKAKPGDIVVVPHFGPGSWALPPTVKPSL